MAQLDYPIRSVQEEFNVRPTDRVEDEDIINYIADRYGFRGVWITKDISAKRGHIGLIKARRISVIWIHKQSLSTSQQHRIITHGIARVPQDLNESKAPLHYLVKFHGQLNREKITYRIQ